MGEQIDNIVQKINHNKGRLLCLWIASCALCSNTFTKDNTLYPKTKLEQAGWVLYKDRYYCPGCWLERGNEVMYGK
jgi:hypothetical protein